MTIAELVERDRLRQENGKMRMGRKKGLIVLSFSIYIVGLTFLSHYLNTGF